MCVAKKKYRRRQLCSFFFSFFYVDIFAHTKSEDLREAQREKKEIRDMTDIEVRSRRIIELRDNERRRERSVTDVHYRSGMTTLHATRENRVHTCTHRAHI